MRKPDSEYWAQRWVQLEDSAHRAAEETATVVDEAYRKAEREVEQQLSSWYRRFADNNGIADMSEARRLLNASELKELHWTVDEYIRHGRENGISADWANELENASARFRITRLEALRLNIQQSAETLFGNQQDALDQLMRTTYMEGYYHSAHLLQTGIGIGWNVGILNEKAIQTAVSRPWSADGKNFSERIWGNRTALISELQRNLTQSLLMENTCDRTIDALVRRFEVSRRQAERLVYTENAYIHSAAQGDSYRENGVKKVIFIATLDDRTSDICREMDGKIIDMKDYAPGTTVPPLHPWCRSVTAPHSEYLDGIGERAARDPENGGLYYVPREMTYRQWEQTFVENGPKDGLTPVNEGATISGDVNACKTVAEVEALLKGRGWFNVRTLQGKTFDTNQRLSLEGCDLETAVEVYKSFERIYDVYPQLIGKLNSVSTADLDPFTYAQCSVGIGHGGITLNRSLFKNFEDLQRSYQKDLSLKFHVPNTTPRSIVTHEMGHAVDDYMTNTLHLAGFIGGSSKPKYVSAAMRPAVMRACGLTVSDAYEEVSGYASKDHYEWFAECFAEILESPQPRKVAEEFKKQLDEYMEKVK